MVETYREWDFSRLFIDGKAAPGRRKALDAIG
jgi:hypothetical protein